MINEALIFLTGQLNEYLHFKMGEEKLVFTKRLVDDGGQEVSGTHKIICQLINIEEERTGKAQIPIAPPIGSSFPIRNPEIGINLAIMFTAISSSAGTIEDGEDDYLASIKMLSYVIQFFQFRHAFNTENSPSLPAAIGNLSAELYPISLESQNYLWASLGVKYSPSVVYKVRLITIFEDSYSGVVNAPNILETNTRTA